MQQRQQQLLWLGCVGRMVEQGQVDSACSVLDPAPSSSTPQGETGKWCGMEAMHDIPQNEQHGAKGQEYHVFLGVCRRE